MKPIPSEYNVASQNQGQVTASSLGNGKVLLYNGANFLHTMDNTARINIWIDDKAFWSEDFFRDTGAPVVKSNKVKYSSPEEQKIRDLRP